MASFVALRTLAGCLAFWLGRLETVSQQAINALVTFTLCPPALFGGWAQVVLYVLIPAGLRGWLPTALLRAWTWADAGLLLAGSTTLVRVTAIAWWRGLARCESGNLTQAVEA